MLILLSALILFLTALTLIILHVTRPAFRFAWLTAVGGAMLALFSVTLWPGQMPFKVSLPPWRPVTLFEDVLSFHADGLSWPYAISLTSLALTILLTAIARPVISSSLPWAGTLALAGLGLLAVTAASPLTLLLVWAALDLTELITQLRSVDSPSGSERVVIAFSTRALGSGLLLWANIVSVSAGSRLDFNSTSPQAGLFLLAAAGLRLGVLPLHLPFPSESVLRRGFGTSLRLVSVASSLALLAHIPAGSVDSPFTPLLFALTAIAALYGGWMWLRAPDELTGRPFWIIGLAALSIAAALGANPRGSVAWGIALLLSGGVLFLASVQLLWLNRLLLIGAWSLSALPFSLTASAWQGNTGPFLPFLVAAQALLIAGFVRHSLRPGGRETPDAQPGWTRSVYPAGISLLLLLQVLLGLLGWEGALQVGVWLVGLVAAFLTLVLIWATPRLRLLNPIRAHWIQPASSWLDGSYRSLWSLYRLLGRMSQAMTSTLEGDGGILWTLLFLVLFVSLMTRGAP
jgi:hypothetical protein